jgi:hypothetical protein
MVLEREDAVAHWRAVLGATDSRSAVFDSLRGRHGDKTGLAIWSNVAHGSDSRVAAAVEMCQFFAPDVPIALTDSERDLVLNMCRYAESEAAQQYAKAESTQGDEHSYWMREYVHWLMRAENLGLAVGR